MLEEVFLTLDPVRYFFKLIHFVLLLIVTSNA